MIKISELNDPPEKYGAERAAEVAHLVAKYSEMHETERAFVTGLILHYKPKKVLEVGVSSGGGSVVILNAIRDIVDAHLYSIDLFEQYYKDKNKPIGWLVEAAAPELSGMRTSYAGKDAAQVMDFIGEVDFLVLDTAHVHPVETLNFLCILPYLKDGAVVVLHDISLGLGRKGYIAAGNANRILFSTVAGEKLTPQEKYAPFPNIGAFQVSVDTRTYLYNMFSSLYLPWGRLYARPWKMFVISELIKIYAETFKRFYGIKYHDMFLDAVKAQDTLYKNVSFFTFTLQLVWQFVNGGLKLLAGKI